MLILALLLYTLVPSKCQNVYQLDWTDDDDTSEDLDHDPDNDEFNRSKDKIYIFKGNIPSSSGRMLRNAAVILRNSDISAEPEVPKVINHRNAPDTHRSLIDKETIVEYPKHFHQNDGKVSLSSSNVFQLPELSQEPATVRSKDDLSVPSERYIQGRRFYRIKPKNKVHATTLATPPPPPVKTIGRTVESANLPTEWFVIPGFNFGDTSPTDEPDTQTIKKLKLIEKNFRRDKLFKDFEEYMYGPIDMEE